jgi:hypothetical protein
MSAMTVWKAALRPVEVQDIDVPAGAELLCAREQGNDICVWFRCDPNAASKKRRVAVVGTGHAAPSEGRYLGSALLGGGAFVFHVFEVSVLWGGQQTMSEATERLTDRERDVMRHALGLTVADKPYRNYFVAGAKDIPTWEGLAERGLAERGAPTKGWNVYCVSEAGELALNAAR